MAKKWARVYICDWCQTIKMPAVYYAGLGDVFKGLPGGWQRVGGLELCNKCFEKFSKIMGEGEEDNAED